MCNIQQPDFDPAASHTPLYATQGGGYATQGGGYATYEDGRYVWHSDIPNFINAQVGDPIPEEWGVVSINEATHREVEEHDSYCEYCCM